jgi:hypothetical protein
MEASKFSRYLSFINKEKGLPKLYLGCSLTHAPKEFREAVEELKVTLRETYDVFDFLGLEKGTAQDVYQWDIHRCVATCDVFLAICDYPSIGLGYELAMAVEKLKKPVFAFAHEDANVSRLILGVDAPSFHFARYKELQDIPAMLMAADLA